MDYIAHMPDSKATATDGATPTEGHVIVFDPAGKDAHSRTTAEQEWKFRGDVRFSGHGNMLFVRFADPWVTVVAGEARVTIVDPYRPDDPARLTLARLTLKEGPATAGVRAWISTDVRLAAEGTVLFNDVYPAGEPMEPLVILEPDSSH
jgi:hypothetical protein